MNVDRGEMSVGTRVHVSGKTWVSNGVVMGFAKDDPTVPWIKCDDGRSWDARDLGSVRRMVQCPHGPKSVYFNNTKIGNTENGCRECGHLYAVTLAFGINKRSFKCKCCRKKKIGV